MALAGNFVTMAGTDETQNYPLTGRFLLGRLRHAMTAEEKDIVESLIEGTERVAAGTVLIERGQLAEQSTMLIDGFLVRTIFEEDHRYVVGMHVPGDFADLHAFALKRLDHNLVSLGESLVGYVSHARLQEVTERHPHLTRLLWFSTLLDAAIHREWILKLEELSAARRVAHVFCECSRRLDMVGLGGSNGFSLPLTQARLASMCGTTAVHMSRALRRLRDETGATFRHGKFQCPDLGALAAFCAFDPSYLYGPGELQLPGGDYED